MNEPWQLLYFFILLSIKMFLASFLKRKLCRSQKCLLRKTVLITGANTGLGYQAALDFAKRGARVILACRNYIKAEEARQQIIEETENSNVVVKIVDLASFESVRSFAKELYQTEDRLDILVNNAGIVFADGTTEDGYNAVMQVNYYSPFLLTNLLLDLMKKSGDPARIINVSSFIASIAIFLNVDKIEKFQGNMTTYSNSKLCTVLFTKELSERLENTKITTYSLHPSLFQTRIARSAKGVEKKLAGLLIGLFFKNVEGGSQTVLYCSLEKNIEKYSGHHFDNCQTDDYRTVKKDPGLPRKLWEITEKIVHWGSKSF